ncbi:MAG: 50S ribosomal protein L18 [Candidatus Omnitrophota bacterium]
MKNDKLLKKIGRHKSICKHLKSSHDRPRLVVSPSLKHFSAQLIDDIQQKTLITFATYQKQIKKQIPNGGNIKAAITFGTLLGEKLKEKGIKKIVFVRAGYMYHGRIKAFAETLRKTGLEF